MSAAFFEKSGIGISEPASFLKKIDLIGLQDHLRKARIISKRAKLMAEEISTFCESYVEAFNRFKRSGRKKPNDFDYEIWEVQDQINSHHDRDSPSEKRLPAAAYWPTIRYLYGLLDLRDRTTSRGRPSNIYRLDLIRRIWQCYPPGFAKKSANSHFEQTVAMVLLLIKDPWIEELTLHDIIVDALIGMKEPTPEAIYQKIWPPK